jgi:hypothetical protein
LLYLAHFAEPVDENTRLKGAVLGELVEFGMLSLVPHLENKSMKRIVLSALQYYVLDNQLKLHLFLEVVVFSPLLS